jgi:hypothetical protein
MDTINTASNGNLLTKEQFWQEHIKLKQSSGVSRAEYCRRHVLSATQFAYWEHREMSQASLSSCELLPVMLSRDKEIPSCESLGTLCSVLFKNGHELKVQDSSVLPLLISLLG